MIAGAVGTIAGSPIPFAPKGLRGSGSSTIFVLTFGTSREVGKIYLAKDSRQSANKFKKTYPFFEDWIEIKKELDPDCKFVSDISNRLDFFKNF